MRGITINPIGEAPSPEFSPFVNNNKNLDRMYRLYSGIWNYLKDNGRTYLQEYDLIMDKKSKLSKSQRDFIVAAIINEEGSSNPIREEEV